jgi:regulator of protease activity HflC (stomatin/prohibitin superfamily)
MPILIGLFLGLAAWFVVRVLIAGIYTIDQNERAVKTIFGRAQRVEGNRTTLDDPIAEQLRPDERERYVYPQVRVIPPGGPYFKMPWEKIHKVSIATTTMNMAVDLEDASANNNGTILEAVTKDQLNTGLTGQIRYRVSESNLYAYLFGIKRPNGPCDGLLRLGPATENRELRSQAHYDPSRRRSCGTPGRIGVSGNGGHGRVDQRSAQEPSRSE